DQLTLTAPEQIDARLSRAGVRAGDDFWLVVSKPFIWCSSSADSALRTFLASRTRVQDSADFKNLYVLRASARSIISVASTASAPAAQAPASAAEQVASSSGHRS